MICRCSLTRTDLPAIWIDCLHTITARFRLLYSDITSYISETLGRVSIMLRFLEPVALLHSRSFPEGVFLPYLLALVSPRLRSPYLLRFLRSISKSFCRSVLFRSVFLLTQRPEHSLLFVALFSIFHCWLPYYCQPVLSLQARLFLP